MTTNMSATPTTTATGGRDRIALLVVDVQNDFCEGGALAVTGGADVATRISAHLAGHHDRYALVVASRDWHRAGQDNGGHFAPDGTDPDYANTWPVHCVAGTPGADYHPNLDLSHVTHHVRKGYGKPAYSMFEGDLDGGAALTDLLENEDITQVEVVGIATDYCVLRTALDAAAVGYPITVLADLCAGVAPESSAAALERVGRLGTVATSTTAVQSSNA